MQISITLNISLKISKCVVETMCIATVDVRNFQEIFLIEVNKRNVTFDFILGELTQKHRSNQWFVIAKLCVYIPK